MSDNPFFYPGSSSDDVYFGQDMTLCLTDVVNDKADVEHTHTGYAVTNHSHSEYATTTALAGKADTNHTHSEYATVSELNGKANIVHTHDDKADVDHVHDYAASNHTHTGVYDPAGTAQNKANEALVSAKAYADDIKNDLLNGAGGAYDTLKELGDLIDNNSDAIDALETVASGKADYNHTHSTYAPVDHVHSNYATVTALNEKAAANHIHSNYAAVSHTHDDKADSTHTHSEYATVTALNGKANASHTHSEYAAVSHTHDDKANSDHTHSEYATVTALNSKAASEHTHTADSIIEMAEALFGTNSGGGVEYSYGSGSGKNVLTEIANMPQGLHTIYAISGTTGNPRTTESFRYLIHKTSGTIGWVLAWDATGSLFTNYQYGAGVFKGWKCLYEATNKMILWSGTAYMQSLNSNPQTITPSKPLSQCRTGWMLLWSDYDPNTNTANDTDFCTTFIPKFTPSGGTWGGKCFYCSIPAYVGGDADNVDTEIRIIKPVYVHDDCLKGSYQNISGGRNDVVLRAVYEV